MRLNSPDKYREVTRTEKFRYYIFVPLMIALVASWWFASTGFYTTAEASNPNDGKCDICGNSVLWWNGVTVYQSNEKGYSKNE